MEVFTFNGFVQRSWVKTYTEFSVWFSNYYKSVNPVGWFLDGGPMISKSTIHFNSFSDFSFKAKGI